MNAQIKKTGYPILDNYQKTGIALRVPLRILSNCMLYNCTKILFRNIFLTFQINAGKYNVSIFSIQ